jgi:hypothetical protein
MHALFPLSLLERVRVRGFKSMRHATKPLTPRPLSLGEGAKARSTENLKYIVTQY